MDNQFRGGRESEAAQVTKQKVRDLLKKAEEYLLALEMETDFKSDLETMRRLQVALLEDFIEVHNAAVRSSLTLPDGKDDVDRLIS